VIVGVNEYASDEPLTIPILEMDPKGFERQVGRLEKLRLERDNEQVTTALKALGEACGSNQNVMPYLIDAAKAYATLGEITDVMREVFGVYAEPTFI
jgi:methylmalonyl-CoA mutase N-terminal domain/subunit